MAWQSLKDRLPTLPLVLAGPILRRVEKRSVSVWIACRDSFSAKLVIGPAMDASNQPLDIKDASHWIYEMPVESQSVALGTNLHVLVVTAEIPSTQAELQPSVLYQYSIHITYTVGSSSTTGPLSNGQWLHEIGILSNAGGLSAITYGAFTAPTFLLTPFAADDLKIAHVSCRKPHGGEVDALAALHEVLVATHADVTKRPCQLFHTGDQIYADDVDPTLLCMVRDASQALLDWPITEDAPVVGPEDAALSGISDPRRPGNRQPTVTAAKLTTTEGANHLLYLGEFYAMYLFAWAGTLWPELAATKPYGALFPPLGAVFPYPGTPTPSIFYAGTMGPVTPIAQSMPTEEENAYYDSINALTRFRKDLPQVRRALANIASYMMFDDHDVTDDWFLTRDWCVDTLAPPPQAPDQSLARRMMQNALGAFAVFQAWGNTPARFKSGQPGHNILDSLEKLGTGAVQAADWTGLGTKLLPTLDTATGALGGGFDWHFSIDFTTYTLLMLDTRTHRGFDNGWRPPRLINDTHLPQQIPSGITSFYIILVSPAPVVGYLPVEKALDFGADVSEALGNLLIQEVPSSDGLNKIPSAIPLDGPQTGLASPVLMSVGWFDPHILRLSIRLFQYVAAGREALLKKLLELRKNLRKATLGELDFEAWGYHPAAFQSLLATLSQYSRVIILSGDVHYAFSNRIEYWNNRTVGQTTLNTYSTFIQFCSSAARNAAGLTHGVDIYSTCSVLTGSLSELTGFGWEGQGGAWHVGENVVPDPAIRKPDWQYRIRFAADDRENADRGLPSMTPQASDPLGLSTMQRAAIVAGQRVVVGNDNIGLIEFVSPQTDLIAAQDFHWSLVGNDCYDAPACEAHTRHELVLDPAAVPAPPWP